MIEASFEQLVQHGLLQPNANIVGGVPWSFDFHGLPVTHERDDCYLIPFGGLGVTKVEPGDVIQVRDKQLIAQFKGRTGSKPTA